MYKHFFNKAQRQILEINQEISGVPELRHLIWNKISSKRQNKQISSKEKRHLKIGSLIFKDKASFYQSSILTIKKTSRYRLTKPSPRKKQSHLPPRYFSKGANEKHKHANLLPIFYLILESNEYSQPHLLPNNMPLIRSLCKGRGTLSQNKQGCVYLDIDNRFILTLMPHLKALGLEKPPYFNLFTLPEGAHIPIISPREAKFHYVNKIKEAGKEFSFEIEGLYSTEPTLWPEVERVWFFKLHSPELENFRKSHFLSSHPGGHSFHIAIAVKPQSPLKKIAKSLPIMRINIAYLAA